MDLPCNVLALFGNPLADFPSLVIPVYSVHLPSPSIDIGLSWLAGDGRLRRGSDKKRSESNLPQRRTGWHPHTPVFC